MWSSAWRVDGLSGGSRLNSFELDQFQLFLHEENMPASEVQYMYMYMYRVSSRFLTEGVQWGMGHKQPVSNAQASKLGRSRDVPLENFGP